MTAKERAAQIAEQYAAGVLSLDEALSQAHALLAAAGSDVAEWRGGRRSDPVAVLVEDLEAAADS